MKKKIIFLAAVAAIIAGTFTAIKVRATGEQNDKKCWVVTGGACYLAPSSNCICGVIA